MRFAKAKNAEQQSVLMLHRARELLVRQRTMLINALRGHCAEFGITAPQGMSRARALISCIDEGDDRLPPLARRALASLVAQIKAIQAEIAGLEKELLAWHRSSEASQRLGAIPGVGVITATALVATVGDASQFRSGRQFAAFLGLVPRQSSSGGRDRLGRISKRGRRISPAFAGARLTYCPALGPVTPAAAFSLAGRIARPPADQCRAGGYGEQDGPHCLGDAQQIGSL